MTNNNAARSDDLMQRLLDEGIKPHATAVARIVIGGDVAVVVFEPVADAFPALKALGWDGASPVFRMSSRVRKQLARSLGASGDQVSKRWLEVTRQGRIFVCMHGGTLLVNYDPGRGYSIETGSTDREWMS